MLLRASLVTAPGVRELYLNAHCATQDKPIEAVAAVYAAARDALRTHRARIFSERVFASPDVVAPALQGRAEMLAELDDGAPPTVLAVHAPQEGGSCIGLQIHAIAGDFAPEPLEYAGVKVGRRYSDTRRAWVQLAGITAPQYEDPARQARALYERADEILYAVGMDLSCVARTWVWLRDILSWYDQFNAARTSVYQRDGLVRSGGDARFLPASTGIGIAPAGSAHCALELIAISDGHESIRCIQSGRDQNSAFSYGSAFARATRTPSPAGVTLFVSGTAAIDAQGRSEHHADARAQIGATLRHVRTLLAEAGWNERQIVSATAYLKTLAVARAFAEQRASLPWPRVELIADVCRDELLFEIEVTAADTA